MGIINRYGALFMATGIDNSGFRRDAREAEGIIDNFGNYARKAGVAIGGMFAVAGVKDFITQMVKVRGEFQLMDTSIQTLLGNKEKADALLTQIKEYAKISPLELKDVNAATQMMLGFNIEAEKVPRFLSAIGDVSMGEKQKFNSLTLAFSQMSAAGKLMGQDLNQMINAGFNPLSVMAEKTGKSIAQLKEEMSAGVITAEMVQQAFIDATEAGGKFYNMSENASKTINGQLSMMQDALDAVFNELGTKNEETIISSIQSVTKLIENYEKIGKILVGLIATYGAYRTAVCALIIIQRTYEYALLQSALAGKKLTTIQALQAVATRNLSKVWLVLNRTMLSNPAVAIATALTGLVAIMWALKDSTTAEEKAQGRLNQLLEKSKEKKESLISKTSELIDKIKDETQTIYAQIEAWKELQKELPNTFGEMTIEGFKKLTQEEIKIIINKSVEEKEIESLNNSYKKQVKIVEELSEKIKIVENSSGSRTTFGKKNIQELINKYTEEKDVLNGIKDKVDEINFESKPTTEKLDILNKELSVLNNEKALIEELITKSGKIKDKWGTLNTETLIHISNLNRVTGLIDKIASKISSLTGGGATTEVKNKSYWEQKKKDAEAARDALGVEKQNTEEWNKYTRQIREAQKNIDKYAAPSKLDDQAQKLREEQSKYLELLKKQSLERIRSRQDLADQEEHLRISLMPSGTDKVIAQRNLDNEREIRALKRQKEDYIVAYIKAEKELFDIQEDINSRKNKNYRKKTFDPASVGVDTSVFDTIINNTYARQSRDQILEQESAWNEYLSRYGTFQQKKQAITEKYNKLINESKTAGEAALLQKELEEALSGLDFSKLKKEINWESIFGDLGKVSKKHLKDLKKQITDFKNSPEFTKNATPEQIKIIEESLDNINSAITNKSGFFGGLGESMKEYEEAIKDVKEAQEELNKAMESGSDAAVEKAQDNLNKAKNRQNNAETGVEKSTDKFITNMNSVAGVMKKLNSTEFSLSNFGDAVATLIDTFSKGTSKIGGLIAAILSIIDAAGEAGTLEFGKNFIGNILNSVKEAAIRDTPTLTFGLVNLDFLKGADYSSYNELKEKYETLNAIWDELIDKKKEYIETSYGEEAYKVGKEVQDLIELSIKSYRNLGIERLNSGASIGSHSIGVRTRKGMSSEGWDEAKKVLGKDFDKFGIGEGRMTGLFDLSIEQLEKLKYEAPTFWAKLDGDVQDYLNKIIKGSERLEEIQKQVKEQLTQVSFDSVFDSFLNTLMDMDKSAAEFADDFEKYLQKAILSTMLGKNFQDRLNAWYEEFAKSNDNDQGITPEDYARLQSEWEGIVSDAVAERDALMRVFGWTPDSSQQATKRGFETMSQDTASELNGRFTALQMAGEEIKTHTGAIVLDVSEMKRIGISVNEAMMDIRDIGLDAVWYLEKISKNTTELYVMNERLEKIEKNTRNL